MSRCALLSFAAISLLAVPASAGPDLVIGSIDSSNNYGLVGGIRAYSFGVTYCNLGDTPADVVDGSGMHPVLGTSMFKYDPGTMRFTQLGVSQVMHQFASLQGTVCGTCQPGGTFQTLGVGCSNPSGPGLMGSQGDLGPRSEVDAYYSGFMYPFTGINVSGDPIFKRLQVEQTQIESAAANYFVEAVVVSPDDGTSENQNNNVGYREIGIVQSTSNATPIGDMHSQAPAIQAWQDMDPGVTLSTLELPGRGVVVVGSRAHDLGGGNYRYDYNVYNQNLSENIDSVSIPLADPAGDLFFNAVDHHSTVDEDIDDSDWTNTQNTTMIRWIAPAAEDPDLRNVIRWGTMHSFSFTTAAAPTAGLVTLRSASAQDDHFVFAMVPEVGNVCAPDLNGDTTADHFDISVLVSSQFDYNADSAFDFFDISAFLQDLVAGCP